VFYSRHPLNTNASTTDQEFPCEVNRRSGYCMSVSLSQSVLLNVGNLLVRFLLRRNIILFNGHIIWISKFYL